MQVLVQEPDGEDAASGKGHVVRTFGVCKGIGTGQVPYEAVDVSEPVMNGPDEAEVEVDVLRMIQQELCKLWDMKRIRIAKLGISTPLTADLKRSVCATFSSTIINVGSDFAQR